MSMAKVSHYTVDMLPTEFSELRKRITFSEPKALGDKGMQQCYLLMDGNQLIVEFPPMRNISGMSQFAEEGQAASGNYTITLSFGSDNPKVEKYHKFLQVLDDVVKDVAMKDKIGTVWMKKKAGSITSEIVDERYSPVIKRKIEDNGEQKYPDSMKIKVNKSRESGQFLVELYDENKELVKDDDYEEELGKGSMVKGIVIYNSVWFSPKGFGIRSTPKVLKTNQKKKIRGYAFIDESDSDNSEEEKEVEKESEKESEKEESDKEESEKEESESEEEEQRPPTPPPVEEKKTRGKKKAN